ncbi:MAG: peptidylprolyl isomerase [Clostridiales bacterium]|nr:peptidylprolyl isomerase [Clostridiales bacterium]
MKEKRNYSLTAKERKQKRMAEQNKKAGVNSSVQKPKTEQKSNAPTASAEAQMALSQKKSKRSAIVTGSVIAVAILMIIVALLVPVILYLVNPYRGYEDVIAKFKLSNGMELEYVIDEDEYDTAATNFIFLATNKYFDNTVFYDAQGGWLRFGGYVAQPRTGESSSSFERTNHRSDSADYCSSFAALPNNRFSKVTEKFGYRLRVGTDDTKDSLVRQKGALAFRTDTSTEFQFFYGDNSETVPNDINSIECAMVGHALNEQTIKNIESIRSTAALNTGLSSGYLWKPPTPNIMIESVKVYNLKSSKWSDFDFLDYLSGNDSSGQRRYTSWYGKI